MGDFYLISLYYATAFLVFCAGIMRGSNLVQICHALGRAQINPTKVGGNKAPSCSRGWGEGAAGTPSLHHPLLWEHLHQLFHALEAPSASHSHQGSRYRDASNSLLGQGIPQRQIQSVPLVPSLNACGCLPVEVVNSTSNL